MDLETTFATIASTMPDNLDRVISGAASYLPDQLKGVIKHAYSYFPIEIDLASAALFMVYFAAASLILGVLGRIALGKRSSLNHSLSSVMGILLVYAITIVVYTFRPWSLENLLSPLPFVTFSGDYLIIFPISDAQFPALCSQILSLIILAFLVNLLDSIIPRGNHIISWYLLRFISIVLSMLLHYGVSWVFRTYLPDFIVTYAPAVLLLILAVMFFGGIVSLILGLVIAISNPFLGAMYTFFFSSVIGKQISKAVFSSVIICGVFYLLEWAGYTVISITAAALFAYIPMVVLFLILWYFLGQLL